MISLGVQPNKAPKYLIADLKQYDEYLSRLTMECMKHEAALCALGFIRFTAPFQKREPGDEKARSGLELMDRDKGARAVERDIRSIFRPLDSTLRGAIDPTYGSLTAFMAWKRRPLPKNAGTAIQRIWASRGDPMVDMAKARNVVGGADRSRMLDSAAQMRRIHDEQRRAYKGRITRHNGPSQDIRRSPYLVEPSIINKYVEQRVKMVGWLKSAWADVIRKIGKVNLNGRVIQPAGNKVPKWISTHSAGGGSSVIQDIGRKHVRIINNVGDNDFVATNADTTGFVIRWRMSCLASNPYQKEVDKSARLWNAGRIKARSI